MPTYLRYSSFQKPTYPQSYNFSAIRMNSNKVVCNYCQIIPVNAEMLPATSGSVDEPQFVCLSGRHPKFRVCALRAWRPVSN